MAIIKNKFLVVLFTILFISIVFVVYKYGLFHGIQSWSEFKFMEKNIEELNNHLKTKCLSLQNVTLNSTEIASFQRLSRKVFYPTQKLYKFWGGKNHSFWWFPLGTQTYGLYVLVENGKIIFFQETISVDSL